MVQSPNVNISLHAQTDIGMVRHGNEDNFLVVDLSTAATWTGENANSPPEKLLAFAQGHYGSLVAVSDGMGGALAGEVASQMAVSAVRDRMLQFQSTPSFASFAFHERLRLAIEQANLLINVESQNNVEYTGMGATFTAAGIDGTIAYLAQVGDSRCYLIRQGKIAQVTKDQSLVSQLVEAGHITEEEAESHTYKNVILQALGAQPRVNVIVDRVRLRKNDVLLLCSDGLSGKVKGPEMLKLFMECNDIKSACGALIKLANERGGEDNITVLIAKVEGDGLPEPTGEEPFKGEFLPRDPSLPEEVDLAALVPIDEETLRPEDHPTAKKEKERVDVVETQEVQATMLNMPAVTPEMLAAMAAEAAAAEAASAPAPTPVPVPVQTSAAVATAEPAFALPDPPAPKMAAAAAGSPSNSNNYRPESKASEDDTKGGGNTLLVLAILIVLALIIFASWKFVFNKPATPETPSINNTVPPTNDAPATPLDKQIATSTVQKIETKLDTLKHDALNLPKNAIQEEINASLKTASDSIDSLKRNIDSGILKAEDFDKQSQTVSDSLNKIEEKIKEASKGEQPTPQPEKTAKPSPKPATEKKPDAATGNTQ